MDIPLGLRHAVESGECVLFIGAGIGGNLRDSHGNSAPNGRELASELVNHFQLAGVTSTDLAKVAQIVEIRKGRTELETFLKKRLSGLEPDEKLRWLFSQKWKAIYTTNYDSSISRGYDLTPEPRQTPVLFHITSEIKIYDDRFEVPVFHLHGMLFGTDDPKIVITESDYSIYKEHRRMLFELLKKDFITSNILYIGYSNQDQNWKLIYGEVSSEFFPSPMPRSYRIDPYADPTDVEILKTKNIETLICSFDEFYEGAISVFGDQVETQDRLQAIRKHVPIEFAALFEKNPAPVARFISSWLYVNRAPYHETPNVDQFLKGDRPNWGLVGAGKYFERDIEEQIYDELLDYATSETTRVYSSLILAPAGYGVTTLLMSLSSRMVSDRAGHVFMLKPGMPLLEGDIEFITSHVEGKIFFVIDNAADYIHNLSYASTLLKDRKRSAMLLLGERTNEWRQGQGKIYPKEFVVEPLSDPEINRLLDFLENNHCLNLMEHLPRDLQFSTIKVRHGKELLVVMREATEGKNFDAIIEDEYHGIRNPEARSAYLIVSLFYLHGAYIRAQLLADLLKISLEELYTKVTPSIEGVVIFDCINESKGLYAARCRHRVIANIVWERCSDLTEKDSIIQEGISFLNLNYKQDCLAFENFIRSDRIVDSLRTLEGKLKFFDVACRKDPKSPYVRQHYARMLSRESKNDLALGQIDEAIKLNTSVRVLYHTKAIILMQLAFDADSVEIGRRRLIQSENNFRKCITMYQRDEYSYQGLAELYIGWAKRIDNEDEAASYIAKAEEVIAEGLKVVRVRDGLWIQSARIQSLLGDEPSRLRALETAVRVSPGSIVARYLLGRAYRKNTRYQEAINILEPNIKNHHEEYRSFVEYAISLLHLQHDYFEVIQILRLSTLYGMGDPRYLSTLGGLLFLKKDFSAAKSVFEEALKKNFTASELNTIQFIPPDPEFTERDLKLSGTVVAVKAGYSMVECTEFPTFLCPGSKYGGLTMEKGKRITFTPGFCAKGPIACKPEEII